MEARAFLMVLSHLVEFLLAIVLVLQEEGAGSNYRFRICFVVMVTDALRLAILSFLVASGVPLRKVDAVDVNSAVKKMQLLLSYTAVFIGICLSMWHAVCVFFPDWSHSSFMLLSVALLVVNHFLVVVHMAVIRCLSYTHRSPPVAKLDSAVLRVKDTSHDSPCAICLDDLEIGEYVTKLRCKHLFHTKCIVKWVETSKRCPFRCHETIGSALCDAKVVHSPLLPASIEPGPSRPVSPTAPSNQANPVGDSLDEAFDPFHLSSDRGALGRLMPVAANHDIESFLVLLRDELSEP